MNIALEPLRIRQRVGLMPEVDCHIPGMNAVTFVAYAGELAGMPPAQALRRAHEVLEYCSLGEARYRQVETYSTGMKQRIKLAQALVHGPKLLFLDEPTNGLDPQGRDEMLDLIRDISHGKGLSVIVSSHLLPDIERTCDAVGRDEGRSGDDTGADRRTARHRTGAVRSRPSRVLATVRGHVTTPKRHARAQPGVAVPVHVPARSRASSVGQILFTAARESGAQCAGSARRNVAWRRFLWKR
jgi:ABC-type nitrate/sulfonate/bicarbonate transport system ATPase subunit